MHLNAFQCITRESCGASLIGDSVAAVTVFETEAFSAVAAFMRVPLSTQVPASFRQKLATFYFGLRDLFIVLPEKTKAQKVIYAVSMVPWAGTVVASLFNELPSPWVAPLLFLTGNWGTFVTQLWSLREARLDPLTGLGSRKMLGLQDAQKRFNPRGLLPRFFARARQFPDQSPLSAIWIDLDHFGKANRELGNAQGDAYLRAFGAFLQAHLRIPNDMAIRLGGEEFLVLLPNTPLANAVLVAERLRAAIETFEPVPNFKVTASLGVHSVSSQDQREDLEMALARWMLLGDQASQRAKEYGRNRVIVADSETMATAMESASSSLLDFPFKVSSISAGVRSAFQGFRTSFSHRPGEDQTLAVVFVLLFIGLGALAAASWFTASPIAVIWQTFAASALTFALAALQRHRLLLREYVDEVTGLWTWRYLDELNPKGKLSLWFQSATSSHGHRRSRTSAVSALVMDIDHFKEVNDQQGHAEGDRLLREMGKIIEGNSRPQDIAVRRFGKRFIVILPNTEVGDARVVAERLTEKVQRLNWRVFVKGEERSVTLSLATAEAASYKTPQEWIESLGSIVDRIKTNGGNQIEWNPSPPVNFWDAPAPVLAAAA